MHYRTFHPTDFEAMRELEAPSLAGLAPDEARARSRTSEAALKFFERSEHSFVAEHEGRLRGMVLAQSVWQGDRPVVLVSLLLGEEAAREGLLHACVKSAYDTAVYEVHLAVTPELMAAARAEQVRVLGQYAVCYLGSRHDTAPGEPL